MISNYSIMENYHVNLPGSSSSSSTTILFSSPPPPPHSSLNMSNIPEITIHEDKDITKMIPTEAYYEVQPYPDSISRIISGGEAKPADMEKVGNNDDDSKKTMMMKTRKHRFAFQTRSHVDILDDGYRWRKYGQKIVKDSKFPRSYYKCTHKECNVKKQVQRSSKDEEIVVTTYEGIHTHPLEKMNDSFEHILKRIQSHDTLCN